MLHGIHHKYKQAPEPKKRKMSRVEKELASLAPWAWDPLVGKHAPGSAMMRDFTEVVADKTVTTNTTSYRFNVAEGTAVGRVDTGTPLFSLCSHPLAFNNPPPPPPPPP